MVSNNMIKVFIGYDSKQDEAYKVLRYSIESRCSKEVSVQPLRLADLKDVYTRSRTGLESTEFSFSRFLCPYLSNYEGWSIFMDCDMLNLQDISKLWGLRDEKYAVQVVKHKHQPDEDRKFLGNVQTTYARKNWSSLILINNRLCKALSPDFINTASGLELHQFRWLADDLIGEIPVEWNHLVDVQKASENICQLHYTNGGPWFDEYKNCGFYQIWENEREKMLLEESEVIINKD